jgi:hypothetical protein
LLPLAIVLLACLLAAPPASAAGSGSFSPAPSLGTPRTGPSAVLLADGRALIAGGYYNFSPALGSAEVFVNGGFNSAGIGSLATPRQGAAAARLGDGRVLVAGGLNDISFLSSAEIFNPATNSFGPAASMPGPRGEAVAAPLPNGRVLIAGGATDGAPSHELASAFVYDAATNNYTPTGAMTTPRQYMVAAPLPDGRVLVAGGFVGFSFLSSAEIFDPATGSFSSTGVGSMTVPRAGAAAAPLPDGRVLIAGGFSLGGALLTSAEVFDPATATFSSVGIGPMASPRAYGAAAPLPDGRVLVAGGTLNASSTTASAEIYAATNTFSATKLKKLKLLVKVSAFGTVRVTDARAGRRSLAASERRRPHRGRKLKLRPSSASGGPGTIKVRLRLTKHAKRKLRRTGKLKVRARITFTPQGGLANSRTAKLKLKLKRKRKR